jgi:CheY-like chemotaxis protein
MIARRSRSRFPRCRSAGWTSPERREAEDGQEALDLLEGGEVPDLLITDSLMPRINGLELVRSIRNSPDGDLSALPVIMASTTT